MSLDDRLLAAQQDDNNSQSEQEDQPEGQADLNENNEDQDNSSSDRAGKLREQKRNSLNDKEEEANNQSLRSLVMASRKKQAIEKAKKEKAERKSISFNKSRILRQSILHIVDSWGATYFYVVYHWFQSKLGNKRKYVKLGSEWLDNPGLTEKQRDEIGSFFAPWENCCFFSLAIGCFVAFLMIITALSLIGYYLAHPVEALWDFLKLIWEILKSIF